MVPYKRVTGRKDYLSTPFLPPPLTFLRAVLDFLPPPFYESRAKIVPNNRTDNTQARLIPETAHPGKKGISSAPPERMRWLQCPFPWRHTHQL